MIKKITSLSTIVAGIMMSGQVMAGAANLAASTTLTPTHCPALANNITVQLSKDVVAGFNCGTTSFVAATCHKTGTNKAQTVAPVWVDDGSGTGTMKIQDGYSNCTDTDNDGTEDSCTFTGRVAFRGDSLGGSVAATPLGDDTVACNTTNIVVLTADDFLATGDTSATTQPQ